MAKFKESMLPNVSEEVFYAILPRLWWVEQ